MKNCITTIFCLLDDFCKEYEKWQESKLLPSNRIRKREGSLKLSELMTIVLYFYLSPCKDFKNYYLYYLQAKYKDYFAYVSYPRIIQLWPSLIMPITVLLHCLKGEETGIYYVDSTKLQICHNKRNSSNRVFKRLSAVGKSSYGWFMGFKLHLIINNKGEVMAIRISKGNINDLSQLEDLSLGLGGKIFADKGYISKDIFDKLFQRGLRLFTNLKRNMKSYLLDNEDKIHLRKRSLIESVFNVLKNKMNLEHTRHRSPINFIVHVIASITAFTINKQFKYFTTQLKNTPLS